MIQESKIKKSELLSINLIEMNASINNVSSGTTPYNFIIKMGYVRPDEDRDYFKLMHYHYDFSGIMRMFNAKIIYDLHYIPLNILYIMYKLAKVVNADSIKITYSANAKIDKNNYSLVSDYYNAEMRIIIDNDDVYQYKKNDLYNSSNHIIYTAYNPTNHIKRNDYNYIMKQINRLRMARQLLIDDDLSNISSDNTIKGYMYNNIFEGIACGIQNLLLVYRQYIISQ